MKASDLIAKIEAYAPRELAWEADPIGLQLGDPGQEIHTVMTALDVRPEVVQEAIEKHVDFIFSHHPLIFKPARDLDLSSPQNKMYADLLKHQIVVYSAHTNLDATKGGMNDWLAETLQIHATKPLLPNDDGVTGIGRIGQLDTALTVEEYAQFIKEKFGVVAVRVIANDLQRSIKTIAVLGGDGGREYPVALAAGADAFVTADLYYHTAHDVLADDFVVIDPDHHMEAVAKAKMVNLIQEWNRAMQWQLDKVFASTINTDPYTYVF
ncbi:Nif3-like dinuclear metal center hexameric protein [Weissella diestrammenae]|uniref:GTP cyclohydrolase 1 type 2 homolog n=1 Tax=Weissella diestrammenae TaxID=1162633 RepID=A0A7G9T5J2_9LACO|nr:Nif3-like dinuclear metal center hexameric protein [Weissella diestrammenae]MCM0582192.1 Nif3-like dinuclear metal center hexameric protein [Weissella diestrammenae]QNN75367.1 Nif3-like dinuclear metal center hexameric protein [Weissella diestrammenae]